MCNFSLSQVVPSHTHISPSGTHSLIDLAFISDVNHCTTIPSLVSADHLGISLSVNLKPSMAKPCKPRKIWLYKNGNYSRAREMIEQSNWNDILDCSVDSAALNWSKRFLDTMDECIHS